MAAVSYSSKRGLSGTKLSDFTRGTLAPNANDFEVRFNTTDANSAAVKVKDLILFLQAIERGIASEIMLGSDWGV